MSNTKKQPNCLQPRILEEEDKGKVDPRIYFIKKCGPEGRTLYLWPWEYEARIQYAKAKGLQKKVERLEQELEAAKEQHKESEPDKTVELLKQVEAFQGTLDRIQKDLEDGDSKKDAIIQAKDRALKVVNTILEERDNTITKLKNDQQNKQRKIDNQAAKLERKSQIIEELEEENQCLKIQVESQKNKIEKLNGKTGLGEGQAQQIMDLKGDIRVLEAKLRSYTRKYGELS